MKIQGDMVVCGKEGDGFPVEKYDPEDEECKNCILRGQCARSKYEYEKFKKQKHYPPKPTIRLAREKKRSKPKVKKCSCKK